MSGSAWEAVRRVQAGRHLHRRPVGSLPNEIGVGCRMYGAGCREQGVACRVRGVRFRVQGAGCRVQDVGCRVQGVGYDEASVAMLCPRGVSL